MSGITQAQALAVLRDLIEQQERLDPEVLAWVAAVAAEHETVGPWQADGDARERCIVGEIVARVFKDVDRRWYFKLYRPLHRVGGTRAEGPYTTRLDAMRAADSAIRARGYWCDEATP